MPALLELLNEQISGDTIRKISDQIGADESSTRKAIAAALPLLIGGLARNANSSERQARELLTVLQKDHDGSFFDLFDDLLDRSAGGHSMTDAAQEVVGGLHVDRRAADGDGILRHILGGKRTAVEVGVSRASGLDARHVTLLLPILAPAVMSALGKLQRQQNLDADGIARLLNRERNEVERQTENMKGGCLLDYLDVDSDGELIDEVAKIGATLGGGSLLSRMFGSR